MPDHVHMRIAIPPKHPVASVMSATWARCCNQINAANFSLGRCDAPSAHGEPLDGVAVVSTDDAVPERVLLQLRENPAVRLANLVEFGQSLCALRCLARHAKLRVTC